MSKPWQPYARHILDAIAKIRRIQMRGDIVSDEVLYDAALRNLQTFFRSHPIIAGRQEIGLPQYSLAGYQRISQNPSA